MNPKILARFRGKCYKNYMPEQFDLFSNVDETPEETVEGSRILYFDLETQKSADDVGGWGNSHLMKLAVGVVWDSREKRHFTYLEQDAVKLAEKLQTADLVVGFNVIGFDYAVLQPYAPCDLLEIPTFDMLVSVHKQLGHRLSLNAIAQATLNAKKSADGLISLQWYKEGKMDKIIEYCIQDVEITRDVFLHGVDKGHLLYDSRSKGRQRMDVDWDIAKLIKSCAG